VAPTSIVTDSLNGKVKVKIRDTIEPGVRVDPKTTAGYYQSGRNYVVILKSKLKTSSQAAGTTAHEVRHWLQDRAKISIRRKIAEFEAFTWQRRVDKSFPLRTDKEVREFINSHPAYKDLPAFGFY
jgi:hypothetical protein